MEGTEGAYTSLMTAMQDQSNHGVEALVDTRCSTGEIFFLNKCGLEKKVTAI